LIDRTKSGVPPSLVAVELANVRALMATLSTYGQ